MLYKTKFETKSILSWFYPPTAALSAIHSLENKYSRIIYFIIEISLGLGSFIFLITILTINRHQYITCKVEINVKLKYNVGGTLHYSKYTRVMCVQCTYIATTYRLQYLCILYYRRMSEFPTRYHPISLKRSWFRLS